MIDALSGINSYFPKLAELVQEQENRCDHFEDILGSYLVKLSTRSISAEDSNEAAKLLKIIGDFERISDHAVNLMESAKELKDKDLQFSDVAKAELQVLNNAVREIIGLAQKAFALSNLTKQKTQPLRARVILSNP